jgi:hypothetical protein
MTINLIGAIALVGALLSVKTAIQATPQVPQSAEELVQALGQFTAALPAAGVPSPIESHRREIYDRLWSLGPTALPALCRGLVESDVQVRRNVALFLGVAGNDWYDRGRPRLVITPCTPALIGALEDSDNRVRELAAQAVPATGAAGASAVPALIRLIDSSSEGDRNSACIALAGIGPAAKDALPALKKALSDPSATVWSFAKHAIERIER